MSNGGVGGFYKKQCSVELWQLYRCFVFKVFRFLFFFLIWKELNDVQGENWREQGRSFNLRSGSFLGFAPVVPEVLSCGLLQSVCLKKAGGAGISFLFTKSVTIPSVEVV